MTCDDARDQLSAVVDGALASAGQALIRAHLAQCPACAAALAELQELDDRLAAAFAPHRQSAALVANAVLRRLPAAPAVVVAHRGHPWRGGLALAASILLVFAVWPSTRAPTAQLRFATAPVYRVDRAMAIVAPAQLDPGAVLRTSDTGRCEVVLDSHTSLFLDRGAEVTLTGDHSVALHTGRIWVNAAPMARPTHITLGETTLAARGGVDVTRSGDAPARWSALVTAGTLHVDDGGPQREALVYHRVGHDAPSRPLDPRSVLDDTGWVTELLAVRPATDAVRLARSTALRDRLLPRSIESCTGIGEELPLIRDSYKPRLAAQLAALAPPMMIPDLIDLLRDPAGAVRVEAARGLRRLTGEDLGRPPEQWLLADANCDTVSPDHWSAWWEANRERFVGSAPDPQDGP